MTELLTAMGALAIILTGIAILLQMISVEDALRFIWRAVAVFVLTVLAQRILRGLWVRVIGPWLSAAFEFLKALTGWFAVTILSVIAVLFVGRVVSRRVCRYLPLRRDPLAGDGYEIHDSKEKKD